MVDLTLTSGNDVSCIIFGSGVDVIPIPSGTTSVVSSSAGFSYAAGSYTVSISATLQGTKYEAPSQSKTITDAGVTAAFVLTAVSG